MTFEMDPKSRRQFARWMVTDQKKVRGAAGMLLNEFAFNTREEAIRFWRVDQTTRNKRFVQTRLRVDKTRLNLPIHMQKSSTYSTSADRFSGWGEQEHGTKTKRKRTATIKGRSGNFRRQIAKKARLLKGRDFKSPRDLGSSSAHIQNAHHAAQVMLLWSRRNLGDEPFLVFGHKEMQPGLFVWRGTKLIRLQYLNASKAQPTRVKWMSISTRRMFRKRSIQSMWSEVIRKQKAFQ